MQMSRNEIIEKLQEVLEFTLGTSPAFTEDSHLINDLGLNSVDMLYLIIATEETFGIRFKDMGILDIPTVGAAVDYIEAAIQ